MPEISQEQFDQLNAKAKEADELKTTKEKLEKDLEDTRMEVLSPEYTKFLESLNKSEDKEKEKTKEKAAGEDDEFSKLTPKQLFERAKKELREENEQALSKKEKDAQEEAKARNAREIAKFAKEHDDFETYRPIMYGLSKDPKNSDMNLTELYSAAKKHVETIKTGSSEAQKEKSRRSTNERPGSDTSSFEKLKKMSTADINREAFDEVRSQLGPIPSA